MQSLTSIAGSVCLLACARTRGLCELYRVWLPGFFLSIFLLSSSGARVRWLVTLGVPDW
jgi:hypothetical protein